MANLKSDNNIDFVILSRQMTCLGYCTIVFACLFVGLMIYLLAIIPWMTKYSYTWEGASNKWYHAMQDGNGEQAIYWAKKIIQYTPADTNREKYSYLAEAYELNGEYELAIQHYDLAYGHQVNNFIYVQSYLCHYASVYYKQGQYTKSFKTYSLFTKDWDKKKRNDNFYREVIVDKIFFPLLCPFKDFAEYQRFMGDEYQKLGCPEEYAETMEKIRKY